MVLLLVLFFILAYDSVLDLALLSGVATSGDGSLGSSGGDGLLGCSSGSGDGGCCHKSIQ